jgi:hypothetical protein
MTGIHEGQGNGCCTDSKQEGLAIRVARHGKAVCWLAALSLASLVVTVAATGQVALAAHKASPGWRIAHVFGASTGVVQLDGVDAVTCSDAWLAGEVFPAAAGQAPIVVEHWAAGTWQQVPVPASLDPGGLTIAGDVIGASSESNAWVFGGYQGTQGPFEVALGWNGTAWTKHRFPLWSSFAATAVFGPTDVWAFGQNQMTGKPLIVRFDGHAWRNAAVPVVPQGASALSPSGIWIVGPRASSKPGNPTFAIARWDGSSWHTTDFPQLKLPTGTTLVSTDILALSRSDVWVTGSLGAGQGAAPGFVLLHLTASGWHQVTVPVTPGTLSGISSDGHRGIWLTEPALTSENEYFLHYAAGQWTQQLAPSTPGDVTQMNSISWAPGASSGWSGGNIVNSDGGSRGVLLKFAP